MARRILSVALSAAALLMTSTGAEAQLRGAAVNPAYLVDTRHIPGIFIEVTPNITVTGKITQDQVPELTKLFKGWLYLAKDVDNDIQLEPNGFRTLDAYPKLAKKHVVVDVAALSPQLAVETVAALDSLPEPVVVTCRSAGRASGVVAMSLAKRYKWSANETLSFSEKKELPYLKNQNITDWVVNYVNTLPK